MPDSPRRRIPFAAKIVLAMLLGLVAGMILGEQTAPLSKLGTVILDLIKALAGPLLFFAVIDAFLRTEVRARSGWLMVGISLTNATLAIVIGLTISNVLQPGRALTVGATEGSSPAAVREGQGGAPDRALARAKQEFGAMAKKVEPSRKIDFFGDLLGLVPTSAVRPFLDNTILSIVLVAVLGGAALRTVKGEQLRNGRDGYRVVEEFVATAYRAVEVILAWVIQLVPIAVFGVVAATVGRYGLEPLRGLVVYLAVGILGLLFQVLVVYQAWLVFVARMPLRRFWSGAREAIVYAMGTASSLATLPVTLRCLDRMRVSPQSARMAACVGTNLNNDGILLYEAMAVLFVAQACGIHLSLREQLLTAVSCAIAGIGISGIPEAGLISLLLVLKTVGQIPDELVVAVVPLLLTVDWILGRCRAMTNVTSDMLVAVLLDRFEPSAAEPDSGVDMATAPSVFVTESPVKTGRQADSSG
jgi:Na+/H+-dicarboxylate symporter